MTEALKLLTCFLLLFPACALWPTSLDRYGATAWMHRLNPVKLFSRNISYVTPFIIISTLVSRRFLPLCVTERSGPEDSYAADFSTGGFVWSNQDNKRWPKQIASHAASRRPVLERLENLYKTDALIYYVCCHTMKQVFRGDGADTSARL